MIAYRDIADTNAMIEAATRYGTRWSLAVDCWGWKRPTA